MEPPQAAQDPRSPPVPGAVRAAGLMRSTVLFGRRAQILIEHAGQVYRLRITRNNKLILTK